MKIIIENKIPFIAGVFEPYAEVSYLAPDAITPEAVRDADALIVRTRTRCNETLFAGSRCRIVATATIGTDHIDLDWCRANGITVANAPGCNAPAVAQYVYACAAAQLGDLRGRTIGVIGVGHVGSIVADWGEALGLKVLRCDPPRAGREGADGFATYAEVTAEADIITLHTPLISGGSYPTLHLANNAFFASLKRKPMFINAARGPVTNTGALITAIESGMVSHTAIDCWENEPSIDRHLLEIVDIATPHIAGYSKEGKLRATQMAVKAVATELGIPAEAGTPCAVTPASEITIDNVVKSYNPDGDTRMLRTDPEQFEALRNGYDLRTEVRSCRS